MRGFKWRCQVGNWVQKSRTQIRSTLWSSKCEHKLSVLCQVTAREPIEEKRGCRKCLGTESCENRKISQLRDWTKRASEVGEPEERKVPEAKKERVVSRREGKPTVSNHVEKVRKMKTKKVSSIQKAVTRDLHKSNGKEERPTREWCPERRGGLKSCGDNKNGESYKKTRGNSAGDWGWRDVNEVKISILFELLF